LRDEIKSHRHPLIYYKGGKRASNTISCKKCNYHFK
jgi:hypothetical protein